MSYYEDAIEPRICGVGQKHYWPKPVKQRLTSKDVLGGSMETIKIIVHERDYDVEFGVEEYQEDNHWQDVKNTVEVSREKFQEFIDLSNRLDELEDYFLGFKSENDLAWEKEWGEKEATNKARREEYMAKVMSDPGYVKAQEKLSNVNKV